MPNIEKCSPAAGKIIGSFVAYLLLEPLSCSCRFSITGSLTQVSMVSHPLGSVKQPTVNVGCEWSILYLVQSSMLACCSDALSAFSHLAGKLLIGNWSLRGIHQCFLTCSQLLERCFPPVDSLLQISSIISLQGVLSYNWNAMQMDRDGWRLENLPSTLSLMTNTSLCQSGIKAKVTASYDLRYVLLLTHCQLQSLLTSNALVVTLRAWVFITSCHFLWENQGEILDISFLMSTSRSCWYNSPSIVTPCTIFIKTWRVIDIQINGLLANCSSAIAKDWCSLASAGSMMLYVYSKWNNQDAIHLTN